MREGTLAGPVLQDVGGPVMLAGCPWWPAEATVAAADRLTDARCRRIVQPTSAGPQLVQASAAAAAAGCAAGSAPSVPEVPDGLLPAAQPFVTVQAEAADGEHAAGEAAAAGGDPANASSRRLSGDAARSVFNGAGV